MTADKNWQFNLAHTHETGSSNKNGEQLLEILRK